jgi:hypothetical protein
VDVAEVVIGVVSVVELVVTVVLVVELAVVLEVVEVDVVVWVCVTWLIMLPVSTSPVTPPPFSIATPSENVNVL